MISVSVSKNLVSEKKYRFRFRKIWYRKKSLGIGFGQNFGIVIQWLQWAENIDLLSLLPFSPSDYRRPLYDCFPPSCSGSLELASLLLPSGQLAKTQCCHLPVLCLSRIELQLSLICKMELRRVPSDPDDLLWDPTSKKEQEAQRWVCGEPRSLLQCCDIEIWKYESRQVLTARHLLDHRTKNFSSPFFLCDRCSMKTLQPWLTSGA